MPDRVHDLLLQYVDMVHDVYGKELKEIILYGSYARGDFNISSDMDIMILVDATEESIKDKGHTLSDITFDFNMDYDVAIMPIVKNINHFRYWSQANLFYKNIQSEGVKLYAA